ncbi:YqaA family protein [Nevskia soli]|uniref:YqaA family protein n=1 Tax=Nevskia soli TaxID=418856 RepID=UPI0015D85A07|nr:VTT domain-containing protein [Nevskia soli]
MLKHLSQALLALGPLGVLLLAFLDSAGIPIPAGMDLLLIFIAIKTPQVAWFSAVVAIIGSTIGNLALFSAARSGGKRFMEHAASPNRSQKFRNWFLRYGLVTVFIPALMPIPMPLKLFVISAGITGTKRTSFVAVILLARVIRFTALVALGLAVGEQSPTFLKAHAWHFIFGAVLLFIALYVLIRLSDRTRQALRSPEGVIVEIDEPPTGE